MADITPRRSSRLQDQSAPSRPTSGGTGSSTDSAPLRSRLPASLIPSTSAAANSYPTTLHKNSPYLPTFTESLILLVYPTTLLLGSIFGLVDPASRASPYVSSYQSHDPISAPSYFAKKGNLFNTLFVKRGWFWVTVSYFLFLFTHTAIGKPGSAVRSRRRLQGALRWGIVTVWWILVTQWFFGPAMIDRGFLLTGGACELKERIDKGETNVDMAESGHVFLLVLGSMFLFEEVLHVILRAGRAKEERVVLLQNGEMKPPCSEYESENAELQVNTGSSWEFGAKIALGVGALSLWMLLMTAAYFHTWFEKFTGLLVAFVGVFVVYFLPRFVPSLRAIIGMPGV